MVTYLQEAFEKPPGNLELEKKKKRQRFCTAYSNKTKIRGLNSQVYMSVMGGAGANPTANIKTDGNRPHPHLDALALE